MFICVYILLSENIPFLCSNVNATENSDPVYTETYLYDMIRDQMIPGVGDPDKAAFDRLLGQLIRNPIVTDPVSSGGSLGFGAVDAIDSIALANQIKGKLPANNDTSPVIKWCDGIPYGYDGSDGTYYCIPPELYPQINDPTLWGNKPPWGDPNQRGEIDTNAISNLAWIYLEDPKTNGVNDEFVDRAREALGLKRSSPIWTGGLYFAYLDSRDRWDYYGNMPSGTFGHIAYKCFYPNAVNPYWTCQGYYYQPNYQGSLVEYRGQKGYQLSHQTRAIPYSWGDITTSCRYPYVGSFNSEEPDFIPLTTVTVPSVYKDLPRPFHPNKLYKGDDVDGYNNTMDDKAKDFVDDNSDDIFSGNDPNNPDGELPVIVPASDVENIPTLEPFNPGGGDTPGGGGNTPVNPDKPVINPSVSADGISLDLDDINFPDLKGLFPFCIPFDLYNGLQSFAIDEESPIWTIPIHIEIQGNVIVDTQIVIDLTQWDLGIFWVVLRSVILVVFIILLAVFTIRIVN